MEPKRIVDVYRSADPETLAAGRAWYPQARRYARELAATYGTTEHRAAGVLAALSPRCVWAHNRTQAAAVLERWSTGAETPPAVGLGLGRARAWSIAHGSRPLDVLGGPKVRAFYRNLTGDLNAVTVDVWAMRVLGIGHNPTPREYPAAVDAYRAAARIIGEEPATVQAVAWCVVRGAAA